MAKETNSEPKLKSLPPIDRIVRQQTAPSSEFASSSQGVSLYVEVDVGVNVIDPDNESVSTMSPSFRRRHTYPQRRMASMTDWRPKPCMPEHYDMQNLKHEHHLGLIYGVHNRPGFSSRVPSRVPSPAHLEDVPKPAKSKGKYLL